MKSTQASSAACICCSISCRKKAALDNADQFTVSWGDIKETVQAQPDDWLARPIRWTKTGAETTPACSKPRAEKKAPGFTFASLE